MNCPKCGAPERSRVRECQTCGTAYASEDLLELRQLEFLLEETASLPDTASWREKYTKRLEDLKSRILPTPSPPVPTPIAMEAPPSVTMPPKHVTEAVEIESETVSFDQWLLSERNIKIALYAGAILLLLAGMIFVGVNWTRIPGLGKLVITLTVTFLMYLGGYLLFQRTAYRLGGIALLGLASGFLTLNFVVLQIYMLGPSGLRNDVMWMIASPICLLLYLLTAYRTKNDLFTYISLIAMSSTLMAFLVVVNASLFMFVLSFSILMLGLLLLVRVFQATRVSHFTRVPLLIVSHAAMPLILFGAVVGWFLETGCTACPAGSPWLALMSLLVGVVFYVTNDVVFTWRRARWVAAMLFPLTSSLILVELGFNESAVGISLMILALAHLGIGYGLEQFEKQKDSGWPLYASAYAIAIIVTIQSTQNLDHLSNVLLGDVVILVVSSLFHRNISWLYGAAWLFMLPFFLHITKYVPVLHNRGLFMGVLGLSYTALGYFLGREELRLGGPFLSAAAFISIIVPALTWGNPIITNIVLGVTAVLYLAVALWVNWSWLIYPVLIVINLMVLTIYRVVFGNLIAIDQTLIISYFSLGILFTLGGFSLQRMVEREWTWPFYVVGIIDLSMAYIAALTLGAWLAVGLSVILGLLFLSFAWLERAIFVEKGIPAVLSYLGISVLFIGHMYLLEIAYGDRVWDIWPSYTAFFCGVFVFLALTFKPKLLENIYAVPMRRSGLWLMTIPLLGSVFLAVLNDEPLLTTLTFFIAGLIFLVDAGIRRIPKLAYLSAGAFNVVAWSILISFEISEVQAFILPSGLTLLWIGWNERRRGEVLSYKIFTYLGLFILLGSAFIQSLPPKAYYYAIWLGVESLTALIFGIRIRSRGYVSFGGVALIVNAITQFGPGFVELPRWIQLGMIGIILLGGGLGALFRREQVLTARKKLSDEWRQWEP